MAALTIAILVLAAASSGAIFKPGDWYRNLRKPFWTPPSWAFPLVWSVLYVLIGYAGWLVYTLEGFGPAMAVWGLQLVFNAAWSWLFFYLRRMDLAFVDICALLPSILTFMALAWPVSTTATLAFLPYALWVVAAGTLNLSVLRLNPLQARG